MDEIYNVNSKVKGDHPIEIDWEKEHSCVCISEGGHLAMSPSIEQLKEMVFIFNKIIQENDKL